MAYRYPLVLDESANLVRELPDGDHLNLTGTPIFDGSTNGANNYILSSKVYGTNEDSPEGSPGVSWKRPADVFTGDEQTLTNKTFESSTVDMGSCVLSNISNSILVNSNFKFKLTSGGTVYPQTTTNSSVNLGGTINLVDLNTDTTYSIFGRVKDFYTAALAYNYSLGYVRLIPSIGVTSEVKIKIQNQYLRYIDTGINTNFLSFQNGGFVGTSANLSTLKLQWSMTTLTAGNYIQKATGNVTRTYNGSADQTFTVDASSTNTPDKVVLRNSTGNFSAGTIYATLNGTATRVLNSLTFSNDIVGYNPTNTASAYSSYDGDTATQINFDATPGSTSVFGQNRIVARNSNGDIWGNTGTFNSVDCSGSLTVSDDILIRNPAYVDGGTEPLYLSGFMKADGSIDTKSYIPVSNQSNAHGKRYVQTTEPSSPANGDIWYEIL